MKQYLKLSVGVFLLFFISSTIYSTAWSDESSNASTPTSTSAVASPQTPSTNTTNSSDKTATTSEQVATTNVQGTVKVIELNLEILKELGLDIKDVIKSAGSLYDEVNIRPVQIITEPEVVGRGNVVYLPIGTRPIGPPAPPRKKRLDRAMEQMIPVIDALKQDVDEVRAGRTEIAVTDTIKEQLRPLFREWGLTVDNIDGQLVALHQLTIGPLFDNAAISARASSIVTDAERLDQTRRKIYKVLQKEGKKEKR